MSSPAATTDSDFQDTPHTDQTAAVLAAYLATSAALRSRLLAIVAAAYASGTNNYGDAAAAAFVAAAVPAVQAAQRTMASLTSAYLAHLVSAAGGGTSAPVGIPQDALSTLRGVDPAEVYRRPYEQLWTALADGKALPDAVAVGQRRALSLASTDLQLAKTRASQIALTDDRRVVGYRRVLVGTHSCGMCVVASSVRYHKSNLMPIHPGCVVGSTSVSYPGGSLSNPTGGVDGVKAATRRSYTGKLITITTALGKQVTITPNHPILTDKGWVPAQFINQDDYVICGNTSHGAIKGSPDKEQCPSLIEDVWRSRCVSGLIQVPLTSEDFHGDGSNGEVEIVYTDGSLSLVGNIPLTEPVGELLFMMGHGSRVLFPGASSFASFLPASRSSGSRDVGGLGLSSSLLSSQLGVADKTGLGSVPWIDTTMFQRSSDSPPLYPVFRSQRQLRLTSEVLGTDLVMGQLSPGSTARRFDPAQAEFSGQGLMVYARLGRSLLDRLAGQVQADRVVSVSCRDVTSCHVYNLHTDEGWYQAGGLVVSNCDCAVAPILARSDPGRTIDSAILKEGSTEQAIGSQGMRFFNHDDVIEVGDLLGPAHDAIRDTFGYSAADAHQLDYRKVILVREHSELGPTLTVANHLFTQKQIDSRDLRAKSGTYHTLKGREVGNIGE